MAVVYSAMGGGVLLLLPASQILIDHVGWRGTYQLFGVIVLVLLLPVRCCRGGVSPPAHRTS